MTVATDDVALDPKLRFEDLVDRTALTELCESFYALFGIGVRIFSSDGTLLAGAYREHEVCAWVNTMAMGRTACGMTVAAVKAKDVSEETTTTHPCFTGQHYRIVAIDYEARQIGRLIIGPYLPAEVTSAPTSFTDLTAEIDAAKANQLLVKVPRAKQETVQRIAKHFRAALDLILFSGHKAFVTSQMHLLSVRESYRELEEKSANLKKAFDRLKELDRLKSNFLATVSHELRTPLTSIIGYSEMLSEGIAGTLSKEQSDFVRTIQEKGEQLLALITGLLDLSKLESGTLTVRAGEIRVEDVLGEVMKTLTPAARKKGVTLKLEGAARLPEIQGDPERLRQVFINLGDNAIKFTNAGGTVTIRTALGDDVGGEDGVALLAPVRKKVEVQVIDTGIGIPDAEKTRVFDAFYQVDSSSTRAYGGTGLGLSIVKRLVEAHGGTVTIEDNVPTGSAFIVRLPAHV